MIRVLTYNVQSPHLPSDPTAHNPRRLQWVLCALQLALSSPPFVPTFVCLQEVCQAWTQPILATLGARGYAGIVHNYAPERREPLCTMVCFPIAQYAYSPLPVRLTNTPAERHWTALKLTTHDVRTSLGRNNGVLAAVFTCHSTRRRLVVGTYHAPCLFKTQPRGHAMHIDNALHFLEHVSSSMPGVPAVLAGDFNMQPSDAAYLFAVRGKNKIDAMQRLHGQHSPTNCCSVFSGCLDYVFCNSHADPVSLSLHAFKCEPHLSEAQPSDHALLQALVRY